jgi:hypothetical protein
MYYSEVPREYQGRVFSVDLLAHSALTLRQLRPEESALAG